MMGIADRTGSLEAGKMADVVLWSRNPFSVYAIAEKVFIDGALILDTSDPATRYRSDFEIGQPVGEEGDATTAPGFRSEEHTSELQSLMRRAYDVFCQTKKKHTRTPLTH